MPISLFDAYLERMMLHRTEKMMDTSQAVIYAQLTAEGRTKMWNGWSNVVSQINNFMLHRNATNEGRSIITWNGQELSVKELIKRFRITFGRGSVIS